MHTSHLFTIGAAVAHGIGTCAYSSCQSDPQLTQPYYPPGAECAEYRIPVTITSENVVFKFPKWENNFQLQDFLTAATTRASANYPSIVDGTKNETATYTIAASFCTPEKKNGKETTVVLATHGIGQARSHWNSPYRPDEYNFVQYAIGKGYSVFFYDRLGTGESQK